MKSVLFIVAPENFRDEELFDPMEVLKKEHHVFIASKDVEVAHGMKGGSVPVDLDIKEVEVDNYDAIIFVGGGGARTYFDDPVAQSIAKEASSKNKILGAICIAPSILANSGLLNGKNATSFPSELDNLELKGAVLSNSDVATDNKLVTATGPSAATDFGKAIASLLNE